MQVMETMRNGVDTGQSTGRSTPSRPSPSSQRSSSAPRNSWIDGAHNRSTIRGFYGAGQEDTSREQAFELDAGEPAILLGTDTGPNPAEYLLHALAGCLTTVARVRRRRPQGPLTEVESTLEGDMDVRGALGLDDDVPQRLRAASASTSPSRATRRAEKLQEIVERAQARSAVFDIGHERRAPVDDRRRPRSASHVPPTELESRSPSSARTAGRRRPRRARRAARRATSRAAPPTTTATAATRSRASTALQRRTVLRRPGPRRSSAASASSSVHDLVVASSRLARGDASVAIGVNMHLVVVAQHRAPLADGARAPATSAARAAFGGSLAQVADDGIVIAAAVSEPGQDLTRPATTRRPHRDRLAHRRPQDLLHDVAGGDRAATRPSRSSTTTEASATATRDAGRHARASSIHDDWDALGMRASGSHSVTFDGVELPAGRAARRLPGRRAVAVHGAQPHRRPVPRARRRSASPRRAYRTATAPPARHRRATPAARMLAAESRDRPRAPRARSRAPRR